VGKRKEIIVDRDRMYALTKDKRGGLFLEVVCGGFAMENVVVRLSPDERRELESRGKEVLDDLALRVVKDRTAFADRIVE